MKKIYQLKHDVQFKVILMIRGNILSNIYYDYRSQIRDQVMDCIHNQVFDKVYNYIRSINK